MHDLQLFIPGWKLISDNTCDPNVYNTVRRTAWRRRRRLWSWWLASPAAWRRLWSWLASPAARGLGHTDGDGADDVGARVRVVPAAMMAHAATAAAGVMMMMILVERLNLNTTVG